MSVKEDVLETSMAQHQCFEQSTGTNFGNQAPVSGYRLETRSNSSASSENSANHEQASLPDPLRNVLSATPGRSILGQAP